jgi:hypothetical protein
MVRAAVLETSVAVYIADPVGNVAVVSLEKRPAGMQSVAGASPVAETDDSKPRYYLVEFDYTGNKFSVPFPSWAPVAGGALVRWSGSANLTASLIGYLSPVDIERELSPLDAMKSAVFTGAKVAAGIVFLGIAAWGLSSVAKLKGRG